MLQVMDDMRAADVDFLTIGQYLQPTPKHHRVDRFVTPEEFEPTMKSCAWESGVKSVVAQSAAARRVVFFMGMFFSGRDQHRHLHTASSQ